MFLDQTEAFTARSLCRRIAKKRDPREAFSGELSESRQKVFLGRKWMSFLAPWGPGRDEREKDPLAFRGEV